MKMEGVSDLVNGRNEVNKPREVTKVAQPSPREIGREFVRQYYTMLSERPQDVYRFYSHESYFVHDSEQPVQGQQKIQRAIERLAFVNCKARIHTVTGTATMNNCLVIQVCGELTVSDIPKRRFLQTFILCPQTPKKYYVLNDVFQWLDRAFSDPLPCQQSQELAHVGNESKDDSSGLLNGDQTSLNGQLQSAIGSSGDDEQRATDLSDEAINISEEDHEEVEPTNERDSYGVRSEEDHQDGVNSIEKTNEVSEEKSAAISLEQEQIVAPSSQQSWAKMVSSSASQNNPHYGNKTAVPPHTISRVAPPSQQVSSSVTPAQNNLSNYHQKESDAYITNNNAHSGARYSVDSCKLYIGNIIRNICPEKTETAEAEIKTALEKYGSVASVKVPPKAIDKGVYHAFAFIVMKTYEGATNVFKAARKDQERNLYFLNMKLNSFGFDGEVTLSTQKNDRMRTPYVHRVGPTLQGISRGNHTRSGMGVRGTNRGLYSKQYGGGSEHRHPANIHAQHE